jgi:hypothetical protein
MNSIIIGYTDEYGEAGGMLSISIGEASIQYYKLNTSNPIFPSSNIYNLYIGRSESSSNLPSCRQRVYSFMLKEGFGPAASKICPQVTNYLVSDTICASDCTMGLDKDFCASRINFNS